MQHTNTLNHHANIPGLTRQTEPTCQPSGPACIYTETNMPTHQDQHANTTGSTCQQRTNMPTHKDQHADRGPTCQQTRINTPTEDQHANTTGSTRRPRTNMPTHQDQHANTKGPAKIHNKYERQLALQKSL